jgi:cytochrome c nitrite reductase small subunit
MGTTSRGTVKRAAILALFALAAGFFLAFGPPGLLAKSEKPLFCASCHVMESEYEAWFHQGAHRRKVCVDCHLPNQNLPIHYLWKSIDGLKDVVFFYSGHVPQDIRLSEHGREAVQANCIRCHETAVERMDSSRVCWDCHRGIMHKRVGTIETR